MSPVTLGVLVAGGSALLTARRAAARLADEEVDRHGWMTAAGEVLDPGRATPRRRGRVVFEMPDPLRPAVVSAA